MPSTARQLMSEAFSGAADGLSGADDRFLSSANLSPTCPTVEVRDLGRMRYAEAFELQRVLVDRRKHGEIPDQFLIVEHPSVVTMGRNGHGENLLAAPDLL